MSLFLNLVVTGLVSGAIYSLIAACLTLSYQTTGIFNLGYGAIAFTSAFVYFMLHVGLHWPIVPSAIVTVAVFAPALGWVLDRLIFRALSNASDAAKIMATVGVLIFVPATAQWIVQLLNAGGAHLPDISQVALAPGIGPSPADNWKVGPIHFNSDQVIVLIVAALVAAVLWFVLQHTRLGLQMRAVVDRPALAQLRGVDRDRTSSIAWVIGTMLAGLAGVSAAPIFNTLDPGIYTLIMFVAIAAAVVGGFRSIPLAFLAGMVLGVLQDLVARYATFAKSISGFNSAVPFVVLLVGIALWGRSRARIAGSASEEDIPVDHSSDLPAWRRAGPWVIAGILLVMWVGFVANRFWLGQITVGLALALISLSFVIITGIGGMVSLAQAAFVTVAALAAGLTIQHYHQPYLVGLLVGIVVAMLLGVVVAMPALRLGGLSLALATLALGFLSDNVLFQWGWFANGFTGWIIKRPKLGGISFANDRTLAVLLMILVAVVAVLVRNLQRSPTGRAMVAVRSSEAAARTSGISPASSKITLFAIGAALAGLGGVMLATYNQSVTGTTYPTATGLIWLAAVVLWGIRRPAGAIVAGLSAALIPALLSGGFHWPHFVPTWLSWHGTKSIWIPEVLFGLGAIQMAKDPNGILSFNAGMARARRHRRATEAAGGMAAAPVGSPAALEPVPAAELKPQVVSGGNGQWEEDAAPSSVSRRAGPPPLLAIDDVSAAYGDVQVLFDLSLQLPAGTITAVVGANGAGKSTLCNVIAGLVPATHGRIDFDGRQISGLRADERARAGLLLAPESRGIFPALTVSDNLLLQLPDPADRARVYERFPALGSRRTQPAGNLSGGEQQMLTVAPLIVHPPKVLVADEPTLGLAPLIASELMNVFRELRDLGVTLLLVEEKARAVLDLADQVVFLELGRAVWSGPRSEVDHDDLVAAYLGRTASSTGSTPASEPANPVA
jgi:branched-subunit amino acid ABC-type transport system permease component/ABC-type branched-subunit amino acid transport system ATPase component